MPGIDAFPDIRIGLIWSAKRDGVCLGQFTIQRFTSGSSSDNADLEWFPLGMQFVGACCYSKRNALGDPAGVNPLNPMISPSSIKEAASAAVRFGKGRLIIIINGRDVMKISDDVPRLTSRERRIVIWWNPLRESNGSDAEL